MGISDPDEDRRALIEALLRRAHEQSRASAERSPFWREGQWRCEYYRTPGPDRLKLFSGERCVLEEPVQGGASADRRAQELRRAVKRGGVAATAQPPFE
jgi:hypothetical protein